MPPQQPHPGLHQSASLNLVPSHLQDEQQQVVQVPLETGDRNPVGIQQIPAYPQGAGLLQTVEQVPPQPAELAPEEVILPLQQSVPQPGIQPAALIDDHMAVPQPVPTPETGVVMQTAAQGQPPQVQPQFLPKEDPRVSRS